MDQSRIMGKIKGSGQLDSHIIDQFQVVAGHIYGQVQVQTLNELVHVGVAMSFGWSLGHRKVAHLSIGALRLEVI